MRVRTVTRDDRPVVELVGRFDAHEVETFRAALEPLVTDTAEHVALDLSQVVFIDSSGLAELVRAQRAARSGGGDLVLEKVSDPVRVILELTALLGVFTLADDGPAQEPA